jgi:hypothetical protein
MMSDSVRPARSVADIPAFWRSQCGVQVGALDLERSHRADVARLLGQWLMHGCTVAPRFTGNWSARIGMCECRNPPNAELTGPQGR